MKYKLVIIALLAHLTLIAQDYSQHAKLLDDYVQKGIEKWNPPGLVITAIKGGEIVFKKGYGTREYGQDLPVDEQTLFACGSTTKAFIAAGLAMLVDEGKINWNDHVIDHLPEFQLKDPFITRELNIKDLLTHRSGLGNTDYLWAMMSIDADSALHKMREVDTAYPLRSGFIYQNLMYLAAGKVIESASGMSWDQFLKTRIYDPLMMNDSYPYLKLTKPIENKAEAHHLIEDKIVRTEQMSADNIGPAGSMYASIDNMGTWIQFLLNEGVTKTGDTLIQPNTFKELFKPQQIVPSSGFYPTQQLTKPNWMTYGLGWFQHDYRGKMVQFHTGSLGGMVAIAGMIPEEEIGVYVMSNLDHVELRHALMYAVFDLFMDDEITRDWSTDLYTLYHPKIDDPEEAQPIKGTSPSINRNELIGMYYNDQYGSVEISNNNGQLQFNINDTVFGRLNYWHYDTYKGVFYKKYWGETMMNFRLDAHGKLSHVEIWGEQFHYSKK